MAPTVHLVTSAAFAALMAIAAVEDFRRLVIPNRVVLGLLLLWPVDLAIPPAATASAAVEAIGGALAVFLCGSLLFSQGFLGGGDVKLMTAAALWAGAARLPALLLLTGVFGGALSLLVLARLGGRIGAVRRAAPGQTEPAALAARAKPVPYGMAIAAAALVVISPFSGA
jgi:prepilin peptidase CpaA